MFKDKASPPLPPTTAFGTTVACVVLFAVLPFGAWRARLARETAESVAVASFTQIEQSQARALDSIEQVQRTIAAVRLEMAQLREVLHSDELKIHARELSEHTVIDSVNHAVEEADKQLSEKLLKLEADTRTTFKDLKNELDIRKNRFVVKWHGDDGVKTSKRMPTEVEALNFFNQVGEFAKKMLMFDGQRWLVLRTYGGDNWLQLIKDDGSVQDGDGKVKKKASQKSTT